MVLHNMTNSCWFGQLPFEILDRNTNPNYRSLAENPMANLSLQFLSFNLLSFKHITIAKDLKKLYLISLCNGNLQHSYPAIFILLSTETSEPRWQLD